MAPEDLQRLAPGVVLSEGARRGGGDAPVGVGLPRNLPVVLADVLVLDLGVGGQVDSHCEEFRCTARREGGGLLTTPGRVVVSSERDGVIGGPVGELVDAAGHVNVLCGRR